MLKIFCPLSAQPGGRGSSEAAGGLREGQWCRQAHEHRQQAESGSCTDTTQAAEGKGSDQNPKPPGVDDVWCVCDWSKAHVKNMKKRSVCLWGPRTKLRWEASLDVKTSENSSCEIWPSSFLLCDPLPPRHRAFSQHCCRLISAIQRAVCLLGIFDKRPPHFEVKWLDRMKGLSDETFFWWKVNNLFFLSELVDRIYWKLLQFKTFLLRPSKTASPNDAKHRQTVNHMLTDGNELFINSSFNSNHVKMT